MIFGDKNIFAIEIEQGNTDIKGHMILWFKGVPIGNKFDNSYSFISLFKDGIITWIIWRFKNKKDEYSSCEISIEDFDKTTTEFTDWFNLKLAYRYPSYNP